MTSAVIMDTLINYYEDDKYHDTVTYFKVRESYFRGYMDNNSINGMSLDIESNFAMLYTLPLLFQFLTEEKIFTEADLKKEKEKIDKLLDGYGQEYSSVANALNELEIYKFITPSNK